MKPSKHPAIRSVLRASGTAMTAKEISARVGIDADNVRQALRRMPDTYIEAYALSRRSVHEALWRVVIPPPNCPHPKPRTPRKP